MNVYEELVQSISPVPEWEMAGILDGEIPLLDEEKSRQQFEGFEYMVDETIDGRLREMEESIWRSRKSKRWTGGTRGRFSRA